MTNPTDRAYSVATPDPAHYVPYRLLGERPNIIVDGKAHESTVLTLSHWPWTTTAAELLRDTSTEIVFAYIDRPDLYQPVDVVSNSHFDEDGLLSMFALVDPETALEHRQLMIDTARAGDFGVCSSPDAAQLSFVLAAYADADTSPLPTELFNATACEKISGLYWHMLERLSGLLTDIPGQRSYWQDEYQHLQQSDEYIETGEVAIDEYPEYDTAVIRIPVTIKARTVRRYLERWSRPVHPFSVHNRTNCNRLVWLQGNAMEAQYRYESWVQLATRQTWLRVDLTGLAEHLNTMETSSGEWQFEGVNAVAPRLHLLGAPESSIDASRFIEELFVCLESQPPAWDPYKRPEDR